VTGPIVPVRCEPLVTRRSMRSAAAAFC